MKSILYILSLYVTVLSVLPCVPETDDCALEITLKDEQQQTALSFFHESEEARAAELCSPFCFCQLCRTVIAFTELPEFTFPNFLYSSCSSLIPGMTAGKAGKIDKPPKSIA